MSWYWLFPVALSRAHFFIFFVWVRALSVRVGLHVGDCNCICILLVGAHSSALLLRSSNQRLVLQMLERLLAEEAALADLKKAVKANKAPGLLSALNKVQDLGMEVPEVELAKEALTKLGAQSEALLKLENAVAAADIPAIDAAIKKVEGMGLGDEEQVVNARQAKVRIVQQNECAAALQAAIGKRDRANIVALLEKGEGLNLAKRFESAMDAGRKLVELMDLEEACVKAIRKAAANNDAEVVDAQEAKARAAGAAAFVFEEAAAARKAISERKEYMDKLTAALEADEKDRELLEQLIAQAEAMGIGGNAKVEQARQTVERERLLKDARKALRKALKAGDAKSLGEALDRALQLGMKGEEVDEANAAYKKLAEESELASGVHAALKALTVKADSKSGITADDLQPLQEAMAQAAQQGLAADSPAMREAQAAKERMEKVLVLQAEITAALEGESLRVMKKVLDKAEDLELGNSSLVKKLKVRVRTDDCAPASMFSCLAPGDAHQACYFVAFTRAHVRGLVRGAPCAPIVVTCCGTAVARARDRKGSL